ncbi:hypothetical protein [Oceanobacillus kapialis]|uniref:Sporulation protein YjcZ n=1 Tax=Oceanobacillus kapialis TaxID=481353 RepID=A0ABW5PVP4_9BACI
MSSNRNDQERGGQRDTFDRAFFGKPGPMILLILAIIIGSILYNYFN